MYCSVSYLHIRLTDAHTGEEAIHRGLKKRLEQLADERERRERAAAAADEEFSAGFLNAARDVFIMMDKDDSGTLTKEEILHAVKNEDEVQKFLISCGNQNLSDLMVPSKLEKTLAELDTDKSGEVDLPEWCVSESQTLERAAVMACWWRRSTSRLTGRCSTQGGGHRASPREQARAAGQGPRRGGGEGARGERGLHEGVPQQGARGIRAHRQGRLRFARDRRDYSGRQE